MTQISTDNQESPLNLDQDIDLFEYLHALLAAKYRILLVAVAVALAVFGYSKTIEDTFSATATVAVNINSEPGGVAPKNYRAGDSLGLIEYDLLIDPAADNEMQRLLARMKSAAFSELFVMENDLLQYIYADQWDSDKNEWIDGFKTSKTDAVLYFRRSMRSVNLDQATKLLDINFVTRDPKLSASLANRFVTRFNQYIQQMDAQEVAERRRFLESRLEDTSNLEIQRSIYRMLETQLATEALIFAKRDYPLEEIQPALPPQFKSAPKRKTWAILGFVGTAFACVVFVLSWVLISKLRKALRAYSGQSSSAAKTPEQPLVAAKPPSDKADAIAASIEEPDVPSREGASVVAPADKTEQAPKTGHRDLPARQELDEWLD